MFTADFHLHSRFSRACSKELTLPNNHLWAKIKGVQVLSTADFTHPEWFKELTEQLTEVEPGLYGLKDAFTQNISEAYKGLVKRLEQSWKDRFPSSVRFILSTEVSLIYKKNGRVRKVHHLILAPNLEIAAKINQTLAKRGNIHSDGRPILGLDSKELLKLLLDISPQIELIPAHAWTPHFSIFGSMSGFDSVEECFDELAPHIHAIETGLSSNPAMNWRLSSLDRYVLISSSDAHSAQKFGREATLFDCELSYPAILQALRDKHEQIVGTIEFFPEEGKYHCDGIRDENLCLQPEETKATGFVSPKSGRRITVGVLHRINDLADRPQGFTPPTARPFWSIIPLIEILAELLGVQGASPRVTERYFRTLEALGPEFYVLKDCPLTEVEAFDPELAHALSRMREGRVLIKPGYDGEYGIIHLFTPGETKINKQAALF